MRVSSAPAQPQSKVNFVSVDLLNEYLSSLYGTSHEGKSIDAFISNKNDLNSEQRGEEIEISRSVFSRPSKFTFMQSSMMLRKLLDANNAQVSF